MNEMTTPRISQSVAARSSAPNLLRILLPQMTATIIPKITVGTVSAREISSAALCVLIRLVL